MKKLILMCGIPASGKSTIATILSACMNNAPAVIHRMYNTLQPPTNEEYSYKKIFEIAPETLDIYKDLVYNIVTK